MPLDNVGKETGWLSKWAFQRDSLKADSVGREAMADGYITAAKMGVAYLPLAGGNMLDDATLGIGTGAPASIIWETQDANANELLIDLPVGGAVDVPVIVIGQGVTGVDLGLYNGVVNPRIAILGIGAVTTAPVWEFRKARGTIAAPTAITTGDDLGSINAYACVAAGEWKQSAAIVFDSVGTIATTRGPGSIEFWTATDAAPSVLTKALTISSAQLATFTGIVKAPKYYTDTCEFYEDQPGRIIWRLAPAGALVQFYCAGLLVPGGAQILSPQGDGPFFQTWGNTDAYVFFKAQDNGVGLVEIMRWRSAADPFVQIGRDDTGVALNLVTDMLVLQAGAGTGNIAANFGLGISVVLASDLSVNAERASLDVVVTNPTLATYAAEWRFNAMNAGAMVNGILRIGTLGLGFFNTTPVAKQAAVADATGGATIDAEARTAINALLGRMRNYGLVTV